MTTLNFNVAGTTFGNRQNFLAGLARSKKPAKITLVRESDNKNDPNAIKVLMNTDHRFLIGYIPKEIAKSLASVMDRHIFVHIDSHEIVGGKGLNYGLKLAVHY